MFPNELPSIESILQKCKDATNIGLAKFVYSSLCNNGLETHPIIGNYIVPMFVENGSIFEATKAFEKLNTRNVYAWTSLISGYAHGRQSKHSFAVYEKMQECGVHPCSHTFVALLKACTDLRDVETGKKIQLESTTKGFGMDVHVDSALVNMYFSFSLPLEAKKVFNNMESHDVVSWNTLITGWVEHSYYEDALSCFEQMKLVDCNPNTITYACILKACASLQEICKGQEVHNEIAQKSLESELLIGNTLINMYSKFGFLLEAEVVFDALPIQDVVSWNALIGGLVDSGPCKKVLTYFERMQLEDIFPDALTFVYILRACSTLCAVEKGLKLSSQMLLTSLRKDILVGNSLVDMYAKCGLLLEAQKAFDELPFHDIVSWNALISGYAEHGPFEEALKCFDQMQSHNVSQDATTFVCTLKACAYIENLEKGLEMHWKITQKGFEKNIFVASTLVDMYAKCGSLSEAEDAFEELQSRDVMLWNALIVGYTEQGLNQNALRCLERMIVDGINPNAVTYSCFLKSCAFQPSLFNGRELHSNVSEKGLESDSFVGSALVNMYAGCGFLLEAQNVFDKLPIRDAACWNALIAGYVEFGLDQEALALYEVMQVEGLAPDDVTFVCTMRACANIGVLDTGRTIHAEIMHKGIKHGLHVGNTILDMYAKCGALSEAWATFLQLPNHDVISWNTIIKGCGLNHDGKLAMHIFEDMRKQGVRPDAVTFTCLLTACSRSSLVLNGQQLFKVMGEEYGIEPSASHYNCMADLLARSGCLYEAEKFFQTLPHAPSTISWTALLSACKTFVKEELGSKCFGGILQKVPDCAALYYAYQLCMETGLIQNHEIKQGSVSLLCQESEISDG